MKPLVPFIALLLTMALIASCTFGLATEVARSTPWPTPTSHALFASVELTQEVRQEDVQVSPQGTPTVSSYFARRDLSPIGEGESSQTSYQEVPPVVSRTTIVTSTVFSDRLNRNWKIVRSRGMEFERVGERALAHNGNIALALSPTQDWGAFYLVVDQETDEAYRRDEVLGISFWLSGGDDQIANDELAVAVLGSNDYPHWVVDDDSVDYNGSGSVSETRLYFLDINRSIPPHTWVEIVVWLDNLEYDPDYEYVTGFYIKNDEGYQNTFYIDDVSLLLATNDRLEP